MSPKAQKPIPNDEQYKELCSFIKIWNDGRRYPANHSLEKHFGKKIRAIRKMAEAYRIYRIKNPECGLPPLALRRGDTGYIIAMSEGVLNQIEPFRIDAKKLKHASTIVVTAAQFGSSVNEMFWDALMHYKKERKAVVTAMAIKYGPIQTAIDKQTGESILTSTFPDQLKGYVLFEDLLLCQGRLNLNVTRFRPTLEHFLTDGVCQMGGIVSQIFAAPKLELEYRPRVGHNSPKAIMTTGACTYPNYQVDKLGQQDRTGEVSTDSHNFSAIVIEVENNSFHFRQLHANKNGEFYDINPTKGGVDLFSQKGVQHRPGDVSALVCGDWHTGITAPEVRSATFGKGSITNVLNPKHVVLHDFFDGNSISPYEARQGARRAYKPELHWDSLEKELDGCVDELNWITSQTNATINVVASNHPEFVAEYVEKFVWVKEDCNLDIGARLHRMMVEDLKQRKPKKHEARASDPVVLWIRERCPQVRMLERQEILLLPEKAKRPILCSLHGDKGTRGAETRSTGEFRKMNQRVIVGHNHSACILGTVWRVGTSTPRMQHYVTLPTTNWTNTHCVIFENGQRMLINIIKGRWYGKQQWEKEKK